MANNRTITILGVNFTQLTGKKAENLVDEYRRAERNGYHYLWEVYGHFSPRKDQAWDDCYAINQKLRGSFMYISGACSTNFSLVYFFKYEGKTYLVKETYCNRYIAEINIASLR